MSTPSSAHKLQGIASGFHQSLQAVQLLRQAGLIQPCHVVLYSTIDAVAWLAASRDDMRTRDSFVAWVDEFLLPAPGLDCSATDLYAAGGVPLILKRLLEAGILHGDEMTVTGRTIGEEAADAKEADGQEVVRTLADPLKSEGGLAILRGNLAPEGSVVKLAGTERKGQTGPARVFESEEDCFRAVKDQAIKPGDIVVIAGSVVGSRVRRLRWDEIQL